MPAVKTMRLFIFLLSAALAAARMAPAEELKFDEYNFAITPPEGWRPLTNISQTESKVPVAYVSPDGNERFLVAIVDRPDIHGPVDTFFTVGFDLGLKFSGEKKISGKYITMDGVKAYERLGEMQSGGKTISTLIDAVPDTGRLYTVQGIRATGSADDSQEIHKALASFRFLTPLKITGDSDPAVTNIAHGIIGGVVCIVLVIFAVIYFAFILPGRKKAAKAASTPPPIPQRPPPPPPMPPPPPAIN